MLDIVAAGCYFTIFFTPMLRKLTIFLCFFLTFQQVFTQPMHFPGSDLPIVVIRTGGQEIPDDPRITADMGIIHNPDGARNRLSDAFGEYDGKISIEIRGQSSQMFPMKAYGLGLRKAAGGSLDRSIFGFPAASEWILYAPYNDKTLMRNVLAYTLSRDMGRWAARCRYVELVIDGDYKGIYVFMERIRRDAGRVDVSKLSPTAESGDALTGGYIFSLDKEPNGWWSSFPPWHAPDGPAPRFSYVYPKAEDISTAQKAYLRRYVDSFETALFGPHHQDPETGVRRYADLSSFIDYFLVNEVSRNVDAYRLSAYFHKDRNSIDGRIMAGPVWDYDLAFRNANYCSGSDVEGWAYRFNEVCPTDGAGLVPFWWERLMSDTQFLAALHCRWKALRQTTLSPTRLFRMIDSVAGVVDEAQKRHFMRWPVLGRGIWPNSDPIPKSYAGEIIQLKTWLNARLAWIDRSLPQVGACAAWPAERTGTLVLSAFPNPFTGDGMVVAESLTDQPVKMFIADGSGRVRVSRTIALRAGRNAIPLQAEAWPSGIYVICLESRTGERFVQRMVKLR